jgi:hypothetical protein
LKEAAGKSKEVFEALMRDNEGQEKKIGESRLRSQELMEKVRGLENTLKNLREVKFQLATDKDLNNPQTGAIKEMQDLLNGADGDSETLIFKDLNGLTWQLKKMPQSR